MKLFNRPESKEIRKKLRNNSTLSEKLLWNQIKNKSFLNLKFRRQHAIGKYVVDFYCHSKNLIIEIDGDAHDLEEVKQKDKIKEEFLRSNGLNILRFPNSEVIGNINKVLEEIKRQTAE